MHLFCPRCTCFLSYQSSHFNLRAFYWSDSGSGLRMLLYIGLICAFLEHFETMAGPDPWNNRVMFERYLYDYLKKKDMHQTAEIFWKETYVPIDPATPPSIDVPGGFLHEWWLIFNEIFHSRVLKNLGNSKAEKLKAFGQRGITSPLGHYKTNDQFIRNLIVSTETGMADPFQSTRLPTCQKSSMKTRSRELCQQGLPTIASESGKLLNLIAEEVGLSVDPKFPMHAQTPPEDQSSDMGDRSAYTQSGSQSIPEVADSSSEVSILFCKHSDCEAKALASYAYDNEVVATDMLENYS